MFTTKLYDIGTFVKYQGFFRLNFHAQLKYIQTHIPTQTTQTITHRFLSPSNVWIPWWSKVPAQQYFGLSLTQFKKWYHSDYSIQRAIRSQTTQNYASHTSVPKNLQCNILTMNDFCNITLARRVMVCGRVRVRVVYTENNHPLSGPMCCSQSKYFALTPWVLLPAQTLMRGMRRCTQLFHPRKNTAQTPIIWLITSVVSEVQHSCRGGEAA